MAQCQIFVADYADLARSWYNKKNWCSREELQRIFQIKNCKVCKDKCVSIHEVVANLSNFNNN